MSRRFQTGLTLHIINIQVPVFDKSLYGDRMSISVTWPSEGLCGLRPKTLLNIKARNSEAIGRGQDG